jgi:flagellar basal-body rod protein FlgC
MSLFSIFDIAGSAVSANTVRMNLVASNLANVESIASSQAAAYRARQPVFSTLYDREHHERVIGVHVSSILESKEPLQRRYQPDHPMADSGGYVHLSNVNAMEEMANMISASRSYQTNVEVMNTVKSMLLRTLTLGQ